MYRKQFLHLYQTDRIVFYESRVYFSTTILGSQCIQMLLNTHKKSYSMDHIFVYEKQKILHNIRSTISFDQVGNIFKL